MLRMRERILVLIPAFNEARTLPAVLTRIPRQAIRRRLSVDLDVLVVDDGSCDDGLDIAQAQGCLAIRHNYNRGYGAALQTGFSFACLHSYHHVVTIDADEQHRPEDIWDLLELRGQGVLVSGTRYLPTSMRLSQPPSPQVNRLFTSLVRLLTGFNITDVGCGFKCIDVQGLAGLQLSQSDYLFPLEFWWAWRQAGLCVREVAVPMIYLDPTRNVGERLGGAAVALDKAVFLLTRLVLGLQAPYGHDWGRLLGHLMCGAPLPKAFILMHHQLSLACDQGLPLDMACANLCLLRRSSSGIVRTEVFVRDFL